MATYSFNQQFAEGMSGEHYLDAFLASRGHNVQPVSRDDQRQGIDRVVTAPDGRVMKVEYKTDFLAGKTGNCFIETVSVDAADKFGWAITSKADYLIYYIPERMIYVLPIKSIHWALPGWMRDYPAKKAPNSGYQTHGVLVPIPRVAEYAVQRFAIGG